MDNMCRTCMSRHDLIPLFSEFSLNTEQLHLATGLQIAPADGLPQTICRSCTDVITSALELRQLCYQVDKTLRKLVSKEFKIKPLLDIDKVDKIFDSTTCFDQIDNFDIKTESQDNAMIVLIDDSKETTISKIDDVTAKNENIMIDNDNINDTEVSDNFDSIDNVDIFDSTSNASFNESRNIFRTKSDNQKDYDKNMNDTVSELENIDIDSIINSIIESNVKASIAYKADELITNNNTKEDNVVSKENNTVKKKRKVCRELIKKYMSLAVTPFNPKGPVKCKMCFNQLKNVQNFRNHAKLHFDPEHMCNECDRSFFQESQLRVHQERFHGKEKRFKCELCSYRACDTDSMRNHVYEVHTGERPFVCNECNAAFRRRSVLIQHIRKHYTIIPTWQCDRCSSMFKSRTSLWSHQHKVHIMRMTYHCYLCSKTYNKVGGVRKHIEKLHGIPIDQQLSKIQCVKTKKEDSAVEIPAKNFFTFKNKKKNK